VFALTASADGTRRILPLAGLSNTTVLPRQVTVSRCPDIDKV
jgi:hypothetical protein